MEGFLQRRLPKRSFIKCLSEINDFIKVNEIQIGFLVTTSFTGEANELTLEELKEHTDVLFDIVTLQEDPETTEEISYAEILEGLRNCVWSNVKISSNHKHSNNTEELENQLNDFEKLLITAQNLRSDTNLTRDEILNKAEQFAEVMSAILNDSDSD
ncbi:uncharacterized protein LOC117787433 isoform X2 [Drosophila innubila]|uniref:uncharacterized protein LOC117787433 isoform X2 n=1 Tax=Drosophila innubila TaxID=198719 RepID=UPI00148C9027|nr:uncharacterized protein LOC117787433 isoform X2 [Drosophila innubila]